MKNKKDVLGGIIIVILLLLVLVTYMSFYNYKKDEEKINMEKSNIDKSLYMIYVYDDFKVEKIENKDSVDTSKTVIGSYNCKSDDCDVYKGSLDNNLYNDKFIMLKENNKVFVYDFTLGKVVSNLYDDIVLDFNDNYFIVYDNYKYGIISKFGIEIVIPTYDEILSDTIYESFVKVKNNNMYGVLDLDNGNLIVDTKYSDIKLTDSKYFGILQDELWYVIDNQGNVVTNGYEDVFAFNKGFIALDNNVLKILKYNKESEELLNENTIDILETSKYKIERNNNILNIEITNTNEILKYEYSVGRNRLINK